MLSKLFRQVPSHKFLPLVYQMASRLSAKPDATGFQACPAHECCVLPSTLLVSFVRCVLYTVYMHTPFDITSVSYWTRWLPTT